jgi:BNR repeat-like domain
MIQSGIGINDFVPMQCVSADGGETWGEAQPVWPQFQDKWSIFCSIGPGPNDDLFLYGIRFPIEVPGETFWSDATQGMKANELVWARSADGTDWTEPETIPMPIAGSAEAPGALCVTRTGRWVACYAPYNTFDPNVVVERNQVVLLISTDEGRSWRHKRMLHFAERDSGAAEAWVVELADGRLLGTCWQVGYAKGQEFSNPYALSSDGGETWSPTLSTGIMGQSTAPAPLPDGRVLLVYNQRKHGEPGVWLAVARPTETDFGIETNEIVWRADQITRHSSSAEHLEWEDFAFGEPSVTVLPDGMVLVTLWCIQPDGQGIRYVRLRLDES